jgi:hypothetical protein
MLPLTPSYDPAKHGTYFRVIRKAIKNRKDGIRNIALTGSYGVGKSSILEYVAKKYKRRVISISLSTLGFADDPVPDTKAARTAATKTNRIQKEIVKQLLYSQDPVKMPGSRYHRNTRFRFWRELALGALIAIPVALVFYLTGWAQSLGLLLPLPKGLAQLTNVAVLIAVAFFVVGIRAIFHNKIQIDKIGAGTATISLSAKSQTYFDEYLDEIVYFFEIIKRKRIVIFEDIDRFEDAHIFETLRSLNTILNGAEQVRGRPISFIYAIKDSIFDELGARAARAEGEPEPKSDDAAAAEVARANRTKFFDLVIPVVPFITHRSARDLLDQTMKDVDHTLSRGLVDLVARHVADMRLIKNIRNEFVIFKERIIDAGSLDLNQDQLFAMVLYKSTHLTDFELIKFGTSDLDKLYGDFRKLVIENTRAEARSISVNRRALDSATIRAGHATRLGDALVAHIDLSLRHIGSPQVRSRQLDGDAIDDNQIRSVTFWEKLASTDGVVQVTYYDPTYGHNSIVSFARADIAEALGQPIEAATWRKAEQERLNGEIKEAGDRRRFLNKATMQDLTGRPEFKLSRDGHDLSFEELARKRLKSELAIQLVANGYIDQNFTLYTSTFYSDYVTANAMNFLLKNVDLNAVDMYYQLSGDEAASVIQERGQAVLEENAAYNVNILDHLLSDDPPRAEAMMMRLLRGGEAERELMRAYLDAGEDKDGLVRKLAGRWAPIFDFLASEAELNDDLRDELFNVALEVASSTTTYDFDDGTRDYLAGAYSQLPAFTSTDTAPALAVNLARLVELAGANLESLAPLNPAVLKEIIRTRSYALNRANLRHALGEDDHGIALDQLLEADEEIYRRAMDDLAGYVTLLVGEEVTIADKEYFDSILEDVLAGTPDQLELVIHRASEECQIGKLEGMSPDIWTPVVKEQRFVVDFANVKAYADKYGIDSAIGSALTNAGRVPTPAETAEPDKAELATKLISAVDQLPSPKLRAELVSTMALKQYLPIAAVPSEPGELIGQLINEDIVEDDATTFAHITSGDTKGRIFAISRSAAFVSFMSVAEVSPAEVGLIVASDLVPDAVKNVIVSRFTEFTQGASKNALVIIARYALSKGLTLTLTETDRLADEGAPSDVVVRLLQPHLGAATETDLVSVLTGLGGEYRKLSSRNGTRPTIPLTDADRALANRLIELQLANSVDERNGGLRVNMKRHA